MTMQFPGRSKINDALFDGPADGVSRGSATGPLDDQKPAGDWLADSPASDGREVVNSDTDHYAAEWPDVTGRQPGAAVRDAPAAD